MEPIERTAVGGRGGRGINLAGQHQQGHKHTFAAFRLMGLLCFTRLLVLVVQFEWPPKEEEE